MDPTHPAGAPEPSPQLLRQAADTAPEQGFSLVEVLAAAFLLAAVLVAIMTMFVYGGEHVKSGKLMTTAVSISSDVQEKFRQLSFIGSYQLLCDSYQAGDTHYCYDSRYSAGAAHCTGGANSCNCFPSNSASQTTLNNWKSAVAKLPQGSITITVRGLRSLNADELDFKQATLLQVVSTIRWTENQRARTAVFQTIKG